MVDKLHRAFSQEAVLFANRQGDRQLTFGRYSHKASLLRFTSCGKHAVTEKAD